MRFERLLHLRGKLGVNAVFEKADATVVVVWILL